MKGIKLAATVGCLAMMTAILAPGVKADEWNKKTTVTFAESVEIPGVHLTGWGVLPPGTYVFKILDSASDRHIVQISDKDETIVYATILAIPNYRMKATDKTVVTFSERPAGQPEALRAWFYPGRNWGEEFVYPKSKAIELAKAANTLVLFTPVELPLEVTEPIKSASAPVVAELKQAPILAIKPTGEEVQLSAAVTPPPVDAEVAVATPVRPIADPTGSSAMPVARTLPSTASSLPLIAFLGLTALGAALTIRAFSRA